MKTLSILPTIFIYFFIISPFTYVKAVNTLTIDCSNKLRKATHCAIGSLYGLIENIPADFDSLVAPLHPFVFNNPARGANGNQQPFGEAIKVAKRLTASPGALVSIRLADILPGWPYRWPGMSNWLNAIKLFIEDKKDSGLTNWYGYEIWNEPDGTWKDPDGLNFNLLWKQTYDYLRQNDPNEKIIGPCYSWYQEDKLRDFLQFTKSNNCIPDIICWHELSGIEGVSSHIKSYRKLENSLGIRELPITINEYCDATHELEGQPGSSARFIGKFERYKVDSAMITWWFVRFPGRLGSLLANDNQKGAGWYFYKWYGDMTGDMVYVTPPSDNSKLVDGAACIDSEKEYISFILGGPNDGSINADFKNIPSFIGSTANVKVEKIDWINKDTVSNGPVTIFEQKYNINNGQLSINIPGSNDNSGYRVYITKGDGTIPSSKFVGTFKIFNRHSGKVLGVDNDSSLDGANVIQWTDNGKTSQQWIISNEGNGYKILNVNANKALDVEKNSLEDGGNILIWSDKGSLNQRWNIRDIGNGYVTIENANSRKMLDVDRESMVDGGNVLQWFSNGKNNQQWKLVPI